MKILYWNSESQLFDKIVDDLATQFELIEFEDISDVVDYIDEEEVDVVLFDYDNERKLIDKAIKKVRKSTEVKLFLHTNELSQKELLKHQKSKISADLYLRSPLEKSLLYSLVLPFFDGEIELEIEEDSLEDTDTDVENTVTAVLSASEKKILGNVLNQHEAKVTIETPKAHDISKKLDEMFLSIFPIQNDELVDEEKSEHKSIENLSDDTLADEVSLDEYDIGEELDLTTEDTDISHGDDDLLDASNNDDKEDVELMSIEEDDALNITDDLALEETDLLDDDSSNDDLLLLDDSEDELVSNIEDLDGGHDDDDLLFDVSSDLSEDIDEELEFTDNNSVDASAEVLDLEEGIELSDNLLEEGDTLDLGDDEVETFEDSEIKLSEGLELSLEDDISLELGDDQVDEIDGIGENDEINEIDEIEPVEEIEFSLSDESNDSFDDSFDDSINDSLEDITPPNERVSASESKMIDQSLEFELDSSLIDDLESDELAFDVGSDSDDIESVDQDTSLIKNHLANKEEVSDQLSSLGVTIKTLREDRELLLQKIEEIENNKDNERRDHLSIKAELDEKSIEVDILKRRFEKKLEILKVDLDISLDKKALLEGRTKMYEAEIEKLNNKVRIDLNKVKMRERELENKLEMLRSDSESQIRNRDLKILELKRKIDTLEFDLDSVQTQEKKVVSNKYELEEKMEKVIETLRGAIGDLEEENVYTRKIKNIKKNLDV